MHSFPVNAKLQCFEFVFHTFLREPSEHKWCLKDILRAYQTLSDHYHHNITLGGPDYSKASTRLAYACKYTPAHAHWLYETLRRCAEIQAFAQRPHLRIAVLGGGPGSEVLGFVKFMVEHGHSIGLTCDIFDRCTVWEDNWQQMQKLLLQRRHLQPEQLSVNYHAQDFFSPLSANTQEKLQDADLVLSSYLLSELRSHETSIRQLLEGAFAALKPGALLVVNDNLKGEAMARVDAAAERCGMKTCLQSSGTRNIHPTDEVRATYDHFWGKLQHNPKCAGELGGRIYAKPSAR